MLFIVHFKAIHLWYITIHLVIQTNLAQDPVNYYTSVWGKKWKPQCVNPCDLDLIWNGFILSVYYLIMSICLLNNFFHHGNLYNLTKSQHKTATLTGYQDAFSLSQVFLWRPYCKSEEKKCFSDFPVPFSPFLFTILILLIFLFKKTSGHEKKMCVCVGVCQFQSSWPEEHLSIKIP